MGNIKDISFWITIIASLNTIFSLAGGYTLLTDSDISIIAGAISGVIAAGGIVYNKFKLNKVRTELSSAQKALSLYKNY